MIDNRTDLTICSGVKSKPSAKCNPSRPHIPVSSDEKFRWVVCEAIERAERINYYLKIVRNRTLYSERLRAGAKELLRVLCFDLLAFSRSKPFGFSPLVIDLVCVGSDLGDDQQVPLKKFIRTLGGAPEKLPALVKSLVVEVENVSPDEDISSSSSSSVTVDPLLPGAD